MLLYNVLEPIAKERKRQPHPDCLSVANDLIPKCGAIPVHVCADFSRLLCAAARLSEINVMGVRVRRRNTRHKTLLTAVEHTTNPIKTPFVCIHLAVVSKPSVGAKQ